jgi:hypothetical protein
MRSSIRLDWEWATTTGGNLSRAEHRYLVGVILRDLPTALTALLRYRLGKRGTGRIDLGEVPVPTSTLARRAEQFVQQELSPLVLEHSYRTYYFGRVLAAGDGAEVDVEAVYLASLLHDLHLEHPTPGKCFAVTGAERTADSMRPTPPGCWNCSGDTRAMVSNATWPPYRAPRGKLCHMVVCTSRTAGPRFRCWCGPRPTDSDTVRSSTARARRSEAKTPDARRLSEVPRKRSM